MQRLHVVALHILQTDDIQKMLIKAKRWQFVSQDYNFVDMLKDCDKALFQAALKNNHCLNHLFHIGNVLWHDIVTTRSSLYVTEI